MVDDVFYILRLCGHRALDTGNLPCVCAVLGQLNTLLSQNYRTALEGRWKVRTAEPALCVCAVLGHLTMLLCLNECGVMGTVMEADRRWAGRYMSPCVWSAWHQG